MAERRMFTQKIIDSDAFLDMPLSTQSLYFHLNMRADDDGFVNNPKRIQRTIGASDDDLKLLIAKRFVIGFESGVLVIKHWRMHNTLRKDRYNPTQYKEELALLDVKDNNAYTERFPELPDITPETVATTWQPNGNHLATQYSIGKYSIDKDSINNIECDSDESQPPAQPSSTKKNKPVKHKYGEYKNVLLTDDELEKLKTEYSDWQERIERLSSYVASSGKAYKSHYATIRNWARKDEQTKQSGRKEVVPGWMNKPKYAANNPFLQHKQNDTDYGALEAELIENGVKTAGNNEDVRRRAEQLKEQLQGM